MMKINLKLFLGLILTLSIISVIFSIQKKVRLSHQNVHQFLKGKHVDKVLKPSIEQVNNWKPSIISSQNGQKNIPKNNLPKIPFQHTGHINVNEAYNSNMYYWYEPALNSINSSVLVWLAGGPGCSSLVAGFYEFGPYKIDPKTLRLMDNPNKMNSKYHLLFIDQPVGTGFSYLNDSRGYCQDENDVARDLFTFFEKFNQIYHLNRNPWFIGGASYAGKYIPAIADKILKESKKRGSELLYPINLQGIGIGDGFTDPVNQVTAFSDFSYNIGIANQQEKEFITQYQNSVVQSINEKRWMDAFMGYSNVLGYIGKISGGVNVYDYTTFNEPDFEPYLKLLNLPQTRKLMHTVGLEFSECDSKVYEYMREDFCKSVNDRLINVLNNSKIRVMIYNGQFDLIIPLTSMQNYISKLKWKGNYGLSIAEKQLLRSENPGKEIIAYYKKYSNFIEMIFLHAGHMSGVNKPNEFVQIWEKFINNRL